MGRFTPGKRPDTHTGSWVVPQGRSGRVWKISLPQGFDPRTYQPVASRYTDCVIPLLVTIFIYDYLTTLQKSGYTAMNDKLTELRI